MQCGWCSMALQASMRIEVEGGELVGGYAEATIRWPPS